MAWDNDKLDRKKSADFLTEYLQARYQKYISQEKVDSFVLAINADWGYGKSFLLRNWKQDLENKKFPVIYFDAWKNDFSGEPLIGFISEIDEALKLQFGKDKQAQGLLKKTITGAKKLIRPTLKTAAEIGLKKIAAHTFEEISEAWKVNSNNTEKSSDIEKSVDEIAVKILDRYADEALKEHKSTKVAIEQFKNGLQKLVEHIKTMESKKLPIFIFIDELDRCRPTYSVELLENIKHLFGVEGVYFVIATNVNQLTHSIGVLYGAGFDSGKYLKRFFDQEYQLPEPNHFKYAEYLFSNSELDDEQRLFTGLTSSAYPEVNLHIKLFSIYSEFFKLSLRDQEQVFTSLNAIILTWKHSTIHLNYLLFLIMLRHRSLEIYDQMRSVNIDRPDLKKLIDQLVDKKVNVFSNYNNNPHNTGIIEIAFIYEDLAKNDLKTLRRDDINIYNFPTGVIKSKLSEEMPSIFYPEHAYPPSLNNYFEIVSYAGHLMT